MTGLGKLLTVEGEGSALNLGEQLPLLLILCLLSYPKTGMVLVEKGHVAEILEVESGSIDTWLVDLERQRLLDVRDSGPILVVSIRMWSCSTNTPAPANGKNDAKVRTKTEVGPPPSIPPPRNCRSDSAAGSKESLPAEAEKQGRAVPEQKTGDGVRGPGSEEEGVWLEQFLDRLVRVLRSPEERPSYRTFCQRYNRKVLETALQRVEDTPKEKIRKSPGALFTYLVKTLIREIQT